MPVNTKRKTKLGKQTKKQTQLTFDPVQSGSSSTSSALPEARVRYSVPGLGRTRSTRKQYADDVGHPDSSGKQYPVVPASSPKQIDGNLPFKSLPTPIKSSQAENISTIANEGHASSFSGALSRHSRDMKHRSSSMFATAEGSKETAAMRVDGHAGESDNSSPEEDTIIPSGRRRNVRHSLQDPQQSIARRGSSVSHPRRSSDSSQDQSESSQQRTPAKSFSPNIFNTPLSGSKIITSKSPSNASKRSRYRKARKSSTSPTSCHMSEDISSSENSVNLPSRKSTSTPQHSRPSRLPTKVLILSEDESSPEAAPSTQRRRKKTVFLDDSDSDGLASIPALQSPSVQSGLNAKDPIQINDDSARTGSISPPKRRRSVSVLSDDEDEQPIISPLKRRRNPIQYLPEMSPAKRSRRPYSVIDNEDDNEDDSDLPSPRKGIKSLQKAKGKGIAEEGTPGRLTRQKVTARRHRTEKEKKLELLRRRRAGEKIDELTDSDSSEEEKAALYDSQEGHEYLSDFPDESEDEAIEKITEFERRKAPRRRNDEHNEDDEDEDDEFVVADEEEILGVPTASLHDIPLQFTYAAHKPLKEHFRDAIEWMIHLKINPAFNKNDPIYTNAFKKLDDEVSGYARSKFLSAAWNEDFSRAIKSRPLIQVAELPAADHLRKCSACNRSGHPSTFIITLSGNPYHKETLEEVEQEESEDEDESHMSINSLGQDLPPDGKEWYVGRTCAMNAEWAHRLSHWKYELNEWVVDNLSAEGYLSGDELAKKERMKSRQKRDYANAIADQWQDNGAIKSLYTDFKRSMEAARASKPQRYSRG
ncbi:hypothetical protein B7463_g5063, partial [Scytalidium lignicola]